MTATRTGSFILFTCDNLFTTQLTPSADRLFPCQPWKAVLCYSVVPFSLPIKCDACYAHLGVPWRCCVVMLVQNRGVESQGDDVWTGV